ncbi:unnamed protein product [Symbiodinium necroappetens]|uniref:Uncharacterized protein n=1 Tax=Symbiodinium necroappetens TaxID=1628268 RepID=A0A812UGI7_9DINO|nr:unnamed protein product [Symbiodinium necroappetens]
MNGVLQKMDELCEQASRDLQQKLLQAEAGVDTVSSPQRRQKFELMAMQKQAGQDVTAKLHECLSGVDFRRATSFCLVHDKVCPIPDTRTYEDQGMLTIAIAGISCPMLSLDWSCMGSKHGLVGKGNQANIMWVRERCAKQEKVIIMECTSLFDESEAATKMLSSLYDFQSIIVGPDDFGLPCTRQRKFSVGILRSWGYMDAPLSEIGSFFKIRRICGDVYLTAPLKDVSEHQASRAAERGFARSSASLLDVAQLLPPAMAVRREVYRDRLREQGLSTGLCMLGQNAESFGHISETCPALLRSSTVWCFGRSAERELLAKEHLVVMGLPVYPHLEATGFACPFKEILDGPRQLSDPQVKALAGNSISVPVFGHLVTYVLAHLQRGSQAVMMDECGS